MSFAEAAGWSAAAIIGSMVTRLALASAALTFVGIHGRRGAESWVTLAKTIKGALQVCWDICHDNNSDKATPSVVMS
jgi:hypothetical protein